MTSGEVAAVTTERLKRWGERLTEAHATPALLVGVGHDHAGGQLHVVIPEDMPTEMAIAFLRKALAEIK